MSGTPAASDSADPHAAGRRRALGVAFLTLFLDLLGFGIILPVQSFYAESFGASATVVTLIGAGYSAMQFVFAPFWGRLSDRIGRRPVVLISIVFACVGWLVLGFAQALWMVALSRLVAGFGNANLGTVQAIVADVTPPQDRAKGMGLIGAAFGLGFLLGPLVGIFATSAWGYEAPAFVAAALAALNWFAALLLLKETRQGASSPSDARRALLPLPAMRDVRTIPGVGPLLVMGFVFSTGFALMEASLNLFIEREYVPPPWGTKEAIEAALPLTQWVFIAVGITAVVVQGGLIRPLRDAVGERALLVAGSLLIAGGFAVTAGLPFLHLPYGALLGTFVVVSVGSGIFSPSYSAALSRAAGEDRQGAVLGVGQSVAALARILGPSLAGALLDLHRSVPFAVGAVLLLVATGLATRVRFGD